MKNVLSMEAMAEWAEKKDPDEYYIWDSHGKCACGQYAAEMGLNESWAAALHSQFWIEANSIAFERPHTFGALAIRLRAVAGCEQNFS